MIARCALVGILNLTGVRATPRADLPARPAEEAVRRLALAELERAEAARERLVDGDRDEALHDLRVALRRLRSLLRSHRAEFSLEFPKKLVRKLGALASSTNPGRDAEVQVDLARAARRRAQAGRAARLPELVRQLEERRDECYRKVEREIVRDFGELAATLREKLSSYRVEMRLDRPAKAPSFAAATRAAVDRAASELTERLVEDPFRHRRSRRPRGADRREAAALPRSSRSPPG